MNVIEEGKLNVFVCLTYDKTREINSVRVETNALLENWSVSRVMHETMQVCSSIVEYTWL